MQLPTRNSKRTLLALASAIIPIVILLCNFCFQESPMTTSVNGQQLQNSSISSYLVGKSNARQPNIALDALSSGTVSKKDDENHQHVDSLASLMLKAYIRSNNIRVYNMDLHYYRNGAKFVGDPKFVDSLNLEHRKRCSQHLQHYENALKSFKESDPILTQTSTDSLRLADVFGRPEAGVLFGNQFWLGSYDNCLDINIKPEGEDPIKSGYCVGVAQFPNWNPQDSRNSIKIGLCLPETCTSSMLNDDPEMKDRVEIMMKYQFGSDQPFNRLRLRQVYCLPHETSEIRQYSQSAKLFYLVVGIIVLTSFICTGVDYLKRKLPPEENLYIHHPEMPVDERNWKRILVDSFSLINNLEKFLRIPESPREAVASADSGEFDRSRFLNSITGLKCIGLLWIICAHTFLVSPVLDRNILNTDKLTKTYLANVYLTAHLMVDTFFALSGVLASYFLFKEGVAGPKTKLSQWIILTIHRYWRLTPIYLLCYWFTKSVGKLLSSGPLWDYGTAEQSPRLNCEQESWWQPILHLSDFKSPKDHCVPFAWFIANGIKFWIVTPMFLVLIHKSIRRGYNTILATVFANILLVGWLALDSNVDVKSVIEFRPESADNMLNNMGQVYTRPYSRIGAYLIGLLAGHLMYMIDTKQFQVNLSKNTKIIVWSLFSVTVILLTFVVKIAGGVVLEEQLMKWVFVVCTALIRPLWALCTCWLVFGLAHGQAKWLSRFLGATFWRILAKLSFCAYLVQAEVIAQLCISKTSSESYTYMDMISRPLVIITSTCFVSFLMLLLLEYPLIGIEELILPRKRVKPAIASTAQQPQQKDQANKAVDSQKLKCT